VRRNACLEVLSNLTNEPLERKLADEELGRLLVSPDLAERDSAWRRVTMSAIDDRTLEAGRTRPEPVRLLHTTGCSGGFASSFGGQLFPRGFAYEEA